MKYFFSASTVGFYLSEINTEMPDDAVEITESVWREYLATPADGKILGADDSGAPSWVDKPALTPEQIAEQAKNEQVRLRTIADSEIAWRQDAVDTEVATDEEKTALADWKKYRISLMRVDLSNPEWPEQPK